MTEGDWANFTCIINCSNTSLRWRLVSPAVGVVNKRFVPTGKLEKLKLWKRKGVVIVTESHQSESGDYESATVRIQASSLVNGAVLQCGAIGTNHHAVSLYSRFAVLQVEPAATSEPATQNTREETTTTQGNTQDPPSTPPPSH